jgi:hypothetical protein
VTECRKPASQ